MVSVLGRGIVGCAVAGLLMTAALPVKKPHAYIEQVATMHVARAAHTSTTLASGDVLIAGGMMTGGGALASAELFEPSTNTLRQIGEMGQARVGHSATRLQDGRVLVVGGYNGEYLQSIEVFDASTGRFRQAGALAVARSGHTATLLPDGRVFIAGGVGRGYSFLSSAELFDPASGRSDLVDPMSVPREGHTATLLADGRVLVIGGHNGRRENMTVFASAEVFSPRTRRFEMSGNLATARHKHDAVRLQDGRVLVIGGADRSDRRYYATTEIYDPATGAFASGPSMVNERYKIAGTSILLADGSVLVTAGARRAELLDTSTKAFREVNGAFPDSYHFAASATLRDGDVLITGGYPDDNRSNGGAWRFRRARSQER
jgi:hypothetical protein